MASTSLTTRQRRERLARSQTEFAAHQSGGFIIMSVQRLTLPALAFIWAGLAADAGEPRPLLPVVSHNQRIANEIAEQFRASGHLRGYRIDVSYHNGVAELSGYVGDVYQRD